jgi:RNA polymerase sigma factor (sigma-70 family)
MTSNPFIATKTSFQQEDELISKAISGNAEALEKILTHYQPWILNIAMRMLWRREDAEDATQDILIKIIKSLSTFRGESTFHTWLYRIAVNHILDMRRRNWLAAEPLRSFADRNKILDGLPNLDLPDPRTVPVPIEILVEEAKIGCTTGVLLCLDGRQRLAFILAEILGATDNIGSEILGVTAVNFRQILSRARRDLYQYLNGSCSLVNPANQCQCIRKTRAFIEKGYIDPEKMQFTPAHQYRIRDVVKSRANELTHAYEQYGAGVFHDHPFYKCSDPAAMFRKALTGFSADILF